MIATWQAAALAPIGAFDVQRLRDVADAGDRVSPALCLLAEEAALLAHRL